MVIQMTCEQPNGNSAVHAQMQTQTETEGYRMHTLRRFLKKWILFGTQLIYMSAVADDIFLLLVTRTVTLAVYHGYA